MKRASLPLLMACAVLAGPADAETSRTFTVAAQLVNGCTASTDATGRWGTIDLGQIDGATAPIVEATLASAAGAGLVLECTPGVNATLTADVGDHPSGGVRQLARAQGGTLAYQLFANGAATPWTTQAVALGFTSAVTRQTVPIRARTLASGPLAAGTYTDTVRVTLSW